MNKLTGSSSSSGSVRSVAILRHDDQIVGDAGVCNSEHYRWKKLIPTSSLQQGGGTRYICIDPSKQYCAVYFSHTLVIDLWDISSLPCLVSRLTLPSGTTLPSGPHLHCQCMTWSDDGRFLCSVFGGSVLSACSSLVVVWQVNNSGPLTIQELPVPVASAAFLPILTRNDSPLLVMFATAVDTNFSGHCLLNCRSGEYSMVPCDVGKKHSRGLYFEHVYTSAVGLDLKSADDYGSSHRNSSSSGTGTGTGGSSSSSSSSGSSGSDIDCATTHLSPFVVQRVFEKDTSVDSDCVGHIYMCKNSRDHGDSDEQFIVKLSISSAAMLTAHAELATFVNCKSSGPGWINPLVIERCIAVTSTSRAGSSDNMVVVHNMVQDRCCGHCRLLLLCGKASKTNPPISTEIRLLSSSTLCTIAILDLSAVLPRELMASTSLQENLTVGGDFRIQDGQRPASFRGAQFISTDESSCAIAVCVATRKIATGRHHPNAAVVGPGGDDDNCKIFVWMTPSIQSKGKSCLDLPSLQSGAGRVVALPTPPFRSIVNDSATVADAFRWPQFSSSDGTLCSGFLARTRLHGGTNALPTKRTNSAWFCNMLMMLDSDQQLWTASIECPTDFPGPMYPPGFHLMQRVEPYIEREDELDVVHTGVAELAENIAQTSSTPNQSALKVRSRFGMLDVGASSEVFKSKLPLRLMSRTDNFLRSASVASDTTTVEGKQPYMTKKRKSAEVAGPRSTRHAVGLSSSHASHDDSTHPTTEESTYDDIVVEMDEPSGANTTKSTLLLPDVLPIPRRVLTGDFLQRVTRERQLGHKLTRMFANPAAIIERLLEFEKEAVENVRRLEVKRDKNRKRDRKAREEKARQRMITEQQKNVSTTASEDVFGSVAACAVPVSSELRFM